MIAVTFADRVHELSIPQAQALWIDGTIDRVRMNGSDYFMASDVALVLANQGLIHEDAFVAKAGIKKGGGQCGRGWVGVKGSCKRLAKGSDRSGAQKAALKEFAQGQRSGKTFAKTSKVGKIGEKRNTTDKAYGRIVDKAVELDAKPGSSATSKRVSKNVLISAWGRAENSYTKGLDKKEADRQAKKTIDRRIRRKG